MPSPCEQQEIGLAPAKASEGNSSIMEQLSLGLSGSFNNKYLLSIKGRRKVNMKMLETDALYFNVIRWVKNLILCCELSLYKLENQTDSDHFFRRGLVCSHYLSGAYLRSATQQPNRSRPAIFTFLNSLSRHSLGSLCLNPGTKKTQSVRGICIHWRTDRLLTFLASKFCHNILHIRQQKRLSVSFVPL